MPSQGNCYLCGKMLGKVAMKNHLLKAHNDTEGDQRCYLLKAEGLYDKDYWLYFDIPVSSNLSAVDHREKQKAVQLLCRYTACSRV